MAKLVLLAGLACIVWRMLVGRWPWQGAAPRRASFAEAQARALLGVGPAADRTEILEAHRRRLAAVHPDRGGSNEQVHETDAARDLLLGALQVQARD